MLPVMMNFSDMSVLVVGAGRIALRQVKKMSCECSSITVIAEQVSEQIKELDIQWVEKTFEIADLHAFDFVICATNDLKLNELIVRTCRERKMLVASVTGVNKGNITFGAHKSLGDLSVMVTTSGKSPALGKDLLEKFIEGLPHDIEDRLIVLGEIRGLLKAQNIENRDVLLREMINFSMEELKLRRKSYEIESGN